MTAFLNITLGLIGIVLLYYGAEWLVNGGAAIARKMKGQPLVIGLTLVAFGTSAPELVVSVDAALTGHGDVCIGNVVGSNICNIALILGLCALISPIPVNARLFKMDVPVLVFASITLVVFHALSAGINKLKTLAKGKRIPLKERFLYRQTIKKYSVSPKKARLHNAKVQRALAGVTEPKTTRKVNK